MKTAEEILEHHGIKGQKWGVRKAARQSARADKKWQKNVYTLKSGMAFHNAVADKVNKDLPAFNAAHKGADIRKNTPSTQKYLKDYNALVTKHAITSSKEVYGKSPSGKLQAVYSPAKQQVIVSSTTAAHASNDAVSDLAIDVDVTNGMITWLSNVKIPLEQSAFDVAEFLEHHGIKGQKWGVRRARSSSGRVSTESRRSSMVSAKLKTHGVKSLTNKEIGDLNKRMQLEDQVKKLNPTAVSKGHDVAKTILAVGTTVNAAIAFSKSPAGAAVKKALIK